VVNDSGDDVGSRHRFTSRQQNAQPRRLTPLRFDGVPQAEGTKGLFLLHAVFRLLESMESHGRYQDGHLHFAVSIGNVTQGVRLEEGGEISRK
jgi:hypothetical protein